MTTRIQAWCTFVLCCSIYAFCLLSGFDAFHLFCLDAIGLVEKLQLWRMVTSPLLHIGILHLAFNMLALVPITSTLEHLNGTIKMGHMIALLALSGDVVFVALSYLLGKWYSDTWLHSCAVGYSGIIFGLIVIDNAASGVSHRSIFGLLSVPARLYAWALLILWQILLPGVSFLGHLGGIVAGEALSRGWMNWAMLPAWLVQRIESTWPASLLTGMDAFILSLPTTASSTLPTSSRSSDSGIGGTTGVSQAISGYARLPAWFSRGWTRVPSNDGDEDLTARANSVVAATSQAAFPGQGRITGQASRPIASPDSKKPAQATAAAAQERARDLGGAQHSSYCASMPPSKQSSSALGP